MQLTQRQKKIIHIISQSKSEITSNQILCELNCSLRTLRNEIQKINHMAKGRLIRSSNKGYFIDQALLETLNIESDSSVNNDIYLILNSLIFDKEEWNFYDLADSLYLSESTLQNRLKSASQLLKKHNLSLNVKNGSVQIMGNEYDKCKLIRSLILNESNPIFLDLENCSDYFLDMDIALLKRIITDAISEHHCYIESYYAENLYLNIMIVLSRIQKNCHMEATTPFLADDSPEISIASKICKLYSLHYSEFTYCAEDISYIAMLISGQVKPQTELFYALPSNDISFKNTINEILLHTFNYYMLNIDYEPFLSSFLLHVYALIRRAHTGQYLHDITVENLKTSCPFIYDVAIYICKQLEEAFYIHIPDAEIGYIAIHIGFAIENATKEDTTVKLLLLCNDYHDSRRRILEKLKAFHTDEIEVICTQIDFNQQKLKANVDMIVTTFPVEIIGKQVVTISPFYTSADAMNVDHAIKQCQINKEKRRNRNLLLNCFHDKLFFIDDSIDTKEKAINFLGNKIEDFGLAPEGFTKSVMQREKTSSTCFFNAFAIPHALEMNARKTMFSVLINKNGILWDEDVKIPIVLMITASQNDRKEFMKIYSSIIRYLWNKDNALSVAKVNNFTEFLDFFQ